ncbi:MAG: DNA-directed RNA polymerase subunit D [Candidatus Diapherotrites archaeon]|nr:DNA-directed RNA polymerase subunit D [Candidatus Diapherotrites archaeon]
MAVSIKKISEKEPIEKYLIKGASIEIMNAIRRSILEDVPCLAIEEVSIYQNDSVMFDEFLAHRLGMLPIKSDAKGYKKGDKLKFVLEKDGPGMVYSKDIKSTDPKVEIVDKKIPIVKLAKDQTIKLEMDAVMHSGKEHAKWQPAVIGYQEVANIIFSKDCDACEECVKACPKNVLEMKAGKVVLTDSLGCILCGACKDACEKKAVKIDVEPKTFVLSIETQGILDSKECLLGAINSLREKSKEFEKLLKKVE